MNVYETKRAEKIARNQALLRDLGLNEKAHNKADRGSRPSAKKRKLETKVQATPSRVSARIAATPSRPVYNEDEHKKVGRVAAKSVARRAAPVKTETDTSAPTGSSRYSPEAIEEIKARWTSWTPSASVPTRSQDSRFHFDDFEDFTPNKSPEEILREGAFGGTFFRPLFSRTLGITVQDDWTDIPAAWISGLNTEKYLTSTEYDPAVNKYGVSCGQSIEEWEAAGWIRHDFDARGWFQWYYRFFLGRRCDDDERQISRWKKCVGQTGRWRRILLKKYVQMGIRTVADEGEEEGEEEAREVSPVVHQTCLHWAYEVRQDALDEFWANGT
ncbi:hypothetical protein EJ05DRAFT_474625 [Pseudovirgaria hyperparasitica]|uniref:Vegetatible incompatibility protein HET-E-1 n=1 Tax=Pseudovirgaria hyperparasitica TaxID=470096 RepID=A0A6A6WC32_9PEZI|nr:uncharacterized protein EJ05DRAFT_474625 [Pseudovirgaria hyperparasitica]KAF2759520.1 hypothetical protein EJ05DRAFT_474625 [Pseudovirgaria hyperparasitica]